MKLSADVFHDFASRDELEALLSRPRSRVRLRILECEVELQSVVVDTADMLHNMQSVGMRMARAIDPCLVGKTDSTIIVCCKIYHTIYKRSKLTDNAVEATVLPTLRNIVIRDAPYLV